MSDYSSYIEKDTFNEALCNSVEEYIQDNDAYPNDSASAINGKTMEIELGTQVNFVSYWVVYPIQSFNRSNEDNSGVEVDIDATHELASSSYFVR